MTRRVFDFHGRFDQFWGAVLEREFRVFVEFRAPIPAAGINVPPWRVPDFVIFQRTVAFINRRRPKFDFQPRLAEGRHG